MSFVTEPTVCVVDPSSSVTRRLCLFDVGCSTKLLLLFDVVGASEVVIIEAAGEAEEVMETSVALGEGETDNRLLEASESTGNPETMD